MKEAIGIGESAELALADACAQLGLGTDEVQYEVIEMGEKKFFGLFGKTPFKVRAYVEESPAAVAAEYLRKVLAGMGAKDLTVEVTEEENGAVLTLNGEDAGIVIGHHGETLDALQYLIGLVANHVRDEYYRITLNTGNYREKREKTLQALAVRMAQKALATNRKYALEPMNPYERRIIHTAVQEIEGATSWSEGRDLDRHVMIGPAAGAAARPAGNDRRHGSRQGREERGENRNRSHNGNRRRSGGRRDRAEIPVKTAAERAAGNAAQRSVVQSSEMDEVLFSAAERGATMPTISDVSYINSRSEIVEPENVTYDAPIRTEETPAVEAAPKTEKASKNWQEQTARAEKTPLYGRIDIRK